MKTQIKATIVADSINDRVEEGRLTSVLCTFPRIILAEVNTHRMLSKSTSSSRAIPFKKMVESVENDPFIPIAWQKPHKGMQGTDYYDHTLTEEVGGLDYTNLPRRWLRARDTAVSMAKIMADERGNMPVTKQLCNRLLEPFMWTTMLITGSKEGWDNFFNLRCPRYNSPDKGSFKSKKDWLATHKYIHYDAGIDWFKINKGQAEIHMMALAECIWDAYNESTPKQLQPGEWHIPFENKIHLDLDSTISGKELIGGRVYIENIIKISTAMCANTSYTTVGNETVKSCEKWLEIHDKLISADPPHSNPLEHCAKAMSGMEIHSFIKGECEFYPTSGELCSTENSRGWCRNFKGFIPYRHLIESKL